MAPIVSLFEGPPNEAFTTLMAYDGSSYVEYVGMAKSYQPKTIWSRAIGNLTNIVVLTNVGTVNITAHGLAVGQRVIISGATVDADLNGSYIVQTVPDANSFTITTASVADATYTEATLVVDTTAPRTSAAVWSIKKLYYTGALNTRLAWAEGQSALNHAWDSRATYAYL